MFQKKIIYGCEARGDAKSPYLTRYTLFTTKRGKLCLHVFHRSDAPDHHDHPFDFITFILWRGYIECTDGMTKRYDIYHPWCESIIRPFRRRLWPLTIHRRYAAWSHRVELVNEKPAVTLVWIKKHYREWGFFTDSGYEHWKSYFKKRGC